MVAKIDGPRLQPASGEAAKQLVIFLHGYGADGNDLIGLGREWASLLPDAAFVSPHAPEALPGQFFGGRQWFPLQTRSEHEWEEGVRKAQPVLDAFISAEASSLKLPLSAVALVGFSQGTMMALHVGLRREKQLAGIVGFSGALAGAEVLKAEIRSRPPVLLAHGDADEMLPYQLTEQAAVELQKNGVEVAVHISQGVGHGIDQTGLSNAARFLLNVLKLPVPQQR